MQPELFFSLKFHERSHQRVKVEVLLVFPAVAFHTRGKLRVWSEGDYYCPSVSVCHFLVEERLPVSWIVSGELEVELYQSVCAKFPLTALQIFFHQGQQ